MQLSVLNDVKKVIYYNNKAYTLNLYITAWDKTCIAYSSVIDPHGDRIFSTVVDPDSCYTLITVNPEEISTVHTMDDVVRHIMKCVETLENGEEDPLDAFELPEHEELDLNLEEEMNRPVYCEATPGMIPTVVK